MNTTKEDTMETQTRDVSVKIEDGTAVYVTDEVAEVIRGDVNRQADEWLRQAVELWDGCDVTDTEELGRVRFHVGMALDCVKALIDLAPLPDEEPAE